MNQISALTIAGAILLILAAMLYWSSSQFIAEGSELIKNQFWQESGADRIATGNSLKSLALFAAATGFPTWLTGCIVQEIRKLK